MHIPDAYSNSYDEARDRLRNITDMLSFKREQHQVVAGENGTEELTIDVTIIGSEKPKWSAIVSSGLHGVEGFFGSAVQLAWLATLKPEAVQEGRVGRVVLIHGINPYGFSKLRRTNENNIDLNRNFLHSTSDFEGTPRGYANLDDFLNPPSPPTSFDAFYAKALWHILRDGLPVLKDSVAGGQYEFPRGLFYGGKELSRSAKVIQQNIERWVAGANDVLHIDLHSGLGEYGQCKLLLADAPGSADIDWYGKTFGNNLIEMVNDIKTIAYRAKGSMGQWLVSTFKHINYRFAAAEFGAHSILRVLSALRSENRAFHYCQPTKRHYQRAKYELMECFCPEDPRWREVVVNEALRIINRGIEAAPFR